MRMDTRLKNQYLSTIINRHKYEFSNTDEQIAKYFLSLGDDIINKTIAILSEEIGVSQSSIFTFVKKIGFKGFQNFKLSVASNLKKENTNDGPANILTSINDISDSDSSSEVAEKVIYSNIQSLYSIIETIPQIPIDQIINIIEKSRTIYFMGIGGSSILAWDSYHKFLRTKYNCSYIFDYHMQLSQASKLNERDCVFLFSHSGESIQTIELARAVHSKKGKIISLTGNPKSELVKLSDECVIVNSQDSLFRAESLTSRILYLTILDIIYVNLMFKDEASNTQSLMGVRNALKITKNGNNTTW